ncbi:MAG: glycosyltransferase family 10 [Rhodocyclaceae bacterium]
MNKSRLRVKVISSLPTSSWLHQFPHNEPVWGECEFLFEREVRDYDWLLVYDDVSARPGETKRVSHEPLACAREHTLLVTSEPSSVKIYGNDYAHQFGAVLTSQPEWALRHPNRIYSQPALHWFYGVGRHRTVSFDDILGESPQRKSHDVSMVYSSKAMRHTLHYHRARFMHRLMASMPELETFGRHSARSLDDKADCLRAYRYHVAVENHIGEHHWTEKISDPFLGLTLPFYCGCPNIAEYFPEESFIRIDLHDVAGAAEMIREAIANREFDKRLPAIIEAKRRVMLEYNLFAVAAREIARLHRDGLKPETGAAILSRRALRMSSSATLVRDMYGKLKGRLLHLPGAISGTS